MSATFCGEVYAAPKPKGFLTGLYRQTFMELPPRLSVFLTITRVSGHSTKGSHGLSRMSRTRPNLIFRSVTRTGE